MNKIKTIFFGSGKFAVPILKKLTELEFINIEAVITQPDKPVGRKQVMTPTPVGIAMKNEELTINNKVEVLKPEKLKLISDAILEKYEPELIIVASYGQIIPHNIVHYPKYKALNFHGSILPNLRGAVPVQIAILKGLQETGVTLQVMEDGMDVGDIISISRYKIKEDETSESLMERLAELSVGMLEDELAQWLNGKIVPKKQDESSATYCYKTDLTKEKAEINESTSIVEADRMIRAFYPWPVAWIQLKIKNEQLRILKIYKARVVNGELIINSPGFAFPSYEEGVGGVETLEIFRIGKQLFLRLKDGYLELLEIQLEGKNRGEAKDYLFLGA